MALSRTMLIPGTYISLSKQMIMFYLWNSYLFIVFLNFPVKQRRIQTYCNTYIVLVPLEWTYVFIFYILIRTQSQWKAKIYNKIQICKIYERDDAIIPSKHI